MPREKCLMRTHLKEFEHEEKEFGLSFPYKETPDQLNAIHMVSKNMEKTTPMDHLVCGDVGFGKQKLPYELLTKQY